MNDVFNFVIRVVQGRDVCIVNMETPGFENIQGSSKRHPDDTPDPIVGQCVAFGRMFQNLATHYEQIVQALQHPIEPSEEPAEMDVAEAAWFDRFNNPDNIPSDVPSQEMGDNQEKEQT